MQQHHHHEDIPPVASPAIFDAPLPSSVWLTGLQPTMPGSELVYRTPDFHSVVDREVAFQLRRFAGWSWDSIDAWFLDQQRGLKQLYFVYVPRSADNEDLAAQILAMPEPTRIFDESTIPADQLRSVYACDDESRLTFNNYPGIYCKGRKLRPGQHSWSSCFVTDKYLVVGMFGLTLRYEDPDTRRVVPEIADISSAVRTASITSGISLPMFRRQQAGVVMCLVVEERIRQHDLADVLTMCAASRNKATLHLAKALGYTFHSTTKMTWYVHNDDILIYHKPLKAVKAKL
ncbi:hypothetical protein GQ42DRAFT_155054 [Ramicandelaber brevisporus]|nr:hypothetical protein GQ42DRAFT_155054 [Ramicandelaber brevisporus]